MTLILFLKSTYLYVLVGIYLHVELLTMTYILNLHKYIRMTAYKVFYKVLRVENCIPGCSLVAQCQIGRIYLPNIKLYCKDKTYIQASNSKMYIQNSFFSALFTYKLGQFVGSCQFLLADDL